MTNKEHIEQLKKLRSFHNGSYGRSINKAIEALNQEPSRDMEEIREVMSCDADAETKCKMISNILTAKPHYFDMQEQCEDELDFVQPHKTIPVKIVIKPCEDVVSRQEVKEQMIKYGFLAPDMTVTEFVEDLPPVTPTRPKGHWIMNRQFERRTCDNCNKEYRWSFYPHNYCPNCGAEMKEGEA